MVISRHPADRAPVDIAYTPQRRHRALPVEVIDRSSVLARKGDRELAERQRVGFHLLIVCTTGNGTHVVDFEPVELTAGTCVRVHPGQVQQFVPAADFESHMVVWPVGAHPSDPSAPAWYPGCGAATSWTLEGDLLDIVLRSIDDLREEQERFDGSPRRIALMQALLSTLLLRLAIEVPESVPDVGGLPQAYVDFREAIEQGLDRRSTVAELAREIGYSSRTLDRACGRVTGKTAKQVLDERVALEIRRLLTHSDRPLGRLAADFGFHDPSNFSKFVKRHLGRLPGQIREHPDPPITA